MKGAASKGAGGAVMQTYTCTRDAAVSMECPALMWSTNWDMMIPLFGGPEDGRKAGDVARSHPDRRATGRSRKTSF